MVGNVSYTVGDGNAAQAGRLRERLISDAGNAAGNGVVAGFATRAFDERGLALIDQDPVHTAENGIERIHRNRVEVNAKRERNVSDIGNTPGKCYFGQSATRERRESNADDAIGDRDVGQACAGLERTTADAGYALGIVTLIRSSWL